MKPMNLVRHYGGTTTHKLWVAWYLLKFVAALVWRALVHDLSKYRPSEARYFIRVIHRLRGSTYGSADYRMTLRAIRPAIDRHNQRNRHHPEHFPHGGVRAMTLVDLVEMLADWQAAVRRHADGDIAKSLEHNADRFNIDCQLYHVIENTLQGGSPYEKNT